MWFKLIGYLVLFCLGSVEYCWWFGKEKFLSSIDLF